MKKIYKIGSKGEAKKLRRCDYLGVQCVSGAWLFRFLTGLRPRPRQIGSGWHGPNFEILGFNQSGPIRRLIVLGPQLFEVFAQRSLAVGVERFESLLRRAEILPEMLDHFGRTERIGEHDLSTLGL